MCSVNGEDGDLLMIPKQSLQPCEKVCRSCDNAAKVVLRKKDAYCKSCFLNSSIHKFRATLGKSKMLKAGDNVLVIFTGSFSSLALLHFLHSGLNEESNKRLMFNVDLLFIDDSFVSGASFEERQKTVEEAKSIAKSFNFKISITTLGEVLSETPSIDTALNVNESLEGQIGEIFESVKSTTAKEDLLYQLRYKLMLKVAGIMGYNKVFTPEIGTDLAIKLLVGISLGRGEQISAEVGFCDNSILTTPVLRPLKDFTKKEIIYYNVFQEIEPMILLSLIKMHSNDISIQKTTEKFVNDLQEKFPSTVYTIFRTGDKLKMCENNVDNEQRNCMLCRKVMRDSYVGHYNVIDALDFSQKMSEVGVNKSSTCCDSCTCGDQSGSFREENMEQFLCYGCSLILRDVERKDVFWKHLIKPELNMDNIQNLRNQISEFLIE